MLNDMGPGDRFYFINDRKKLVWQLCDTHPFEFRTQKGFKVKYANCRQGTESSHINQSFKALHHKVIFLRNINDTSNESVTATL